MDILTEYSEALKRIQQLIGENQSSTVELEVVSSNLDLERMNLQSLEDSLSSSITDQTRIQLEKLTAKKRSEYLAQLSDADSKLRVLKEKFDSDTKRVKESDFSKKFERDIKLLGKAKKVAEKCEKEFGDSIGTEVLDSVQRSVDNALENFVVDYAFLSDIAYNVQILLQDIPQLETRDKYTMFARKLVPDKEHLEKFSPRTRLYIYVAYVGLLVALLLAEPALVSFPYCGALLYYMFGSVKNTYSLLEIVYPYKILKAAIKVYEDDIRKRSEEIRQGELKKIQDAFENQTKPIKDKQQQMSQKISGVAEEVKRTTRFDDLIEGVKKEYDTKRQDLLAKVDDFEFKQEILEKSCRDNDDEIERLNEKVNDLRQQIQVTYLNPSTPGKSRLLVKSFFLGFEDDGRLIEFNYGGQATLIVYKGDTSAVNAPLITMMLMQLMAGMSILSLRIAVTDTLNGGASYAVFAPKELEDKITICATDNDVKDIISEFHQLMQIRTSTILTEAQSLDEYNQSMIDRDSLTEDYVFLFIQDPDSRTLGSQEFLQLCRAGARVGIIPIVFISGKTLADTLRGNESDLQNLSDFVESLDDKFFVFNGDTKDLSYQGQTYKDVLISKIKKGLSK